MKCRKTRHLGSFVLAVVLAGGLPGLAPHARADAPAYDLCIEQSPAKAGRVSPDSGTHRFLADSVVPLTADPQPGYQFAYWLGDVADPKSQRTTVHVNAPKVIVAVFRPADDNPFNDIKSGSGGGGDLLPTINDFSTPGWSPSGGARPTTRTVFVPVIPTPEPTTILLLALGAVALRRTPGARLKR